MSSVTEWSEGLVPGQTEREPLVARDDSRRGGVFDSRVRPCVAEAVGVALFVFIGTMAVGSGVRLGVALAHGLAIVVLVASTAGISGGHLNPAVTLAVLLCGEISPVQASLYVISQTLGAIIGSATCLGVLGDDVFVSVSGGAHSLGPMTSQGQGFLCEVILTSVLVSVVLLTALDHETRSPLAPVAIGLAVAVCIMAGIMVTGGGMNPARSLGPAVIMTSLDGPDVWTDHWLYWLAPATGSVLATLWYRLVLAGEDKRLLFK